MLLPSNDGLKLRQTEKKYNLVVEAIECSSPRWFRSWRQRQVRKINSDCTELRVVV